MFKRKKKEEEPFNLFKFLAVMDQVVESIPAERLLHELIENKKK
jgi:hypothetical protein